MERDIRGSVIRRWASSLRDTARTSMSLNRLSRWSSPGSDREQRIESVIDFAELASRRRLTTLGQLHKVNSGLCNSNACYLQNKCYEILAYPYKHATLFSRPDRQPVQQQENRERLGRAHKPNRRGCHRAPDPGNRE
jgi:hypothetical protein